MKETMTNCILHIAIWIVLIYASICALVRGIIEKDCFGIVFFLTFTILFIISLVCEYKKCKRIEQEINNKDENNN